MPELDLASLAVSFVVSGIGFVLLVYGKRMSRGPHMVTGLVLSVFPYFIGSAPIVAAIGGLICLILWLGTSRLGW